MTMMNISMSKFMNVATYLVAMFLLVLVFRRLIRRKRCTIKRFLFAVGIYFFATGTIFGFYNTSVIYVASILESGFLAIICNIIYKVFCKIRMEVK